MPSDGDVLTLNSSLPGGSGSIDGENKFEWSPPASTPPSGAAGGSLAGTYPDPSIAAGAVTDTEVAAANKDGAAATPSLRTLGTGANQAVAGNDPRLPTVGTFTYSMVDVALAGFAATSNVGGNQTTGVMYYATRAMTCTGIRFYWKRAATDRTVNVAIWSVTTATTGTKLANIDVAVTASGVYTGTFATPVAITAGMRFMVTVWEKSGAEYTGGLHGAGATFDTCILGKSESPVSMCGGNLLLLSSRVGGANAFPNATAAALSDIFYPVEPVLTIP